MYKLSTRSPTVLQKCNARPVDHFSKPAAYITPNAIYQLRDISGGYSPDCMQPTQEMLAHLNVWTWWNYPLSITDKKPMKTLTLNWYECLMVMLLRVDPWTVSLIYSLTCSVYWFIYVFIDLVKRNQLNSNSNVITGCIPHDALSHPLTHSHRQLSWVWSRTAADYCIRGLWAQHGRLRNEIWAQNAPDQDRLGLEPHSLIWLCTMSYQYFLILNSKNWIPYQPRGHWPASSAVYSSQQCEDKSTNDQRSGT